MIFILAVQTVAASLALGAEFQFLALFDFVEFLSAVKTVVGLAREILSFPNIKKKHLFLFIRVTPLRSLVLALDEVLDRTRVFAVMTGRLF